MIYIVLACIIAALIPALFCAKITAVKTHIIIDISALLSMLIVWLICNRQITALLVYALLLIWCVIGLLCRFLARKLPIWIERLSLKMKTTLKKCFLTPSQLVGINVWFYHLKYLLVLLFIAVCFK